MNSDLLKNYKINIIENINLTSDLFFKIEVVGDCQVGKTSILKKIIENKFNPEYIPTSGYEFYPYMFKIEDKYIKFQIWDMCGQENYRSALLNLYRNASLGILVYSITDYKTFQNLDTWITQMRKNAPFNSKIILLGNKADDEQNREVTYEQGKKVCQKYNLEFFMEVSAKSGFKSPNFLEISAAGLYDEFLHGEDTETTTNNNESISLDKIYDKKKFHCC